MRKTSRRTFVKNSAAVAGVICTAGMASAWGFVRPPRGNHDVRIERMSCSYEEHVFRAPLKFAQAVVNRQTMVTVHCTVRTAAGKVATGFGTLPLNYVFTFPSRK